MGIIANDGIYPYCRILGMHYQSSGYTPLNILSLYLFLTSGYVIS